tara:strand:- start:441 stop:626 length:186 start_codon:yes stop_codon:yes gene_type:complete
MPIWLRKYHIRRIKEYNESSNPGDTSKEDKPSISGMPTGPGVENMSGYKGKADYKVTRPKR